MLRRLVVASGLLLGAAARGQEPTFSLDAVLVTTFDHPKEIARSRVILLEGMLRETLQDRHLVVPMSDVPAFEIDTVTKSAETYLQGCPTAHYAGCALVVGVRASVDWVVGAELREEGELLIATVSYVDVKRGELMFQTNAVFDGEDDDVIIVRLGQILDAVIAGEFVSSEIRDVEGIERRAEEAVFERRRIEVEGLELQEMEAELGEVEREETDLEQEKLTRDALSKYDGQEGSTPWKRLKMTRFQYLRQRNTRIPLDTFRYRMRGRQGEILVGTGGVFGAGPWGQRWEGWYGLDAADLSVIERAVSLDQVHDIETTWQFELGAGVLPWLDVMAYGGTRASGWTWRVQQVVEGDEEPVDEPARKVVATWFAGGRVGFAPLPTYVARPTLSVGAAWWGGTDQSKVIQVPSQLPALPPDWMVTLQISPGFEVDLGRHIHLWGRLNLDIPVAGRVLQENASDGPLLAARPAPTLEDDGVGVAGAVGVTARIRIGGRR